MALPARTQQRCAAVPLPRLVNGRATAKHEADAIGSAFQASLVLGVVSHGPVCRDAEKVSVLAMRRSLSTYVRTY